MYEIEEQSWGYRITFGRITTSNELLRWIRESEKILDNKQGEFFVFVDMRTLVPLDKKAQEAMREGQSFYRRKGMLRSVVILSSPVIAAQFRRIGGETGIGRWERYIDASTVADWEKVGMNWLFNAVEPDEVNRPIHSK